MLGTEIIAFGYIEVEKSKFHRYKNTIFLNDMTYWYLTRFLLPKKNTPLVT